MKPNIKISPILEQMTSDTDNFYWMIGILTPSHQVYIMIENEQTARTIHQLLGHCPISMLLLPLDHPT